MAKVVLSNGYEFELVANGISSGADTISATFKPLEYTIAQLEQMWTGNSLIKVVLGEDDTIGNYEGYIKVKTISKINDYEESVDEEGNPVLITVCNVVCAKADINDRVHNVEEAVEDIINYIL